MQTKIYEQKQTEDMNKKKMKVINKIILFAIIIVFFSVIAVLSFFIEKPKSEYTLTNTKSEKTISCISSTSGVFSYQDSNAVISEVLKYPVYIVGEINKPGIYEIIPGIFLYQLVDMAGGLTSKAAKNSINLAFQITRNQMIRIPSIDEVNDGNLGGIEEDLLLDKYTGIDNSSDEDQLPTKININTADTEELDKLPGIGASTAKLIIDYRTKNGEFKLIEDIMKISGIKENKFNQIKEQITVE